MSPLKHTLSPSASIESEMLELLAHQGRLGPIPVLIALSVIAAFSADHHSPWLWSSWLVLCALVLVLRSTILISLPQRHLIAESRRLHYAIALSALNACTHALSLFFFFELSPFERMVQTMVFTGIGAITVITTAGYLPISLAYLIPTLVPLSALWVYNYTLPGGDWISLAIAGLIFWSNAIMLLLSRDTFQLFRESFAIRQRQSIMNRRLTEALQDTESANRAKTRFLASASHDLRQPIHALSLFGGALAKRPLDDESREIAQHMDLALQSLTSRLDSLLDISKLDAGIIQVRRAPFNLRLLVERLQDEFMPSAAEKGLKIWLDAPDDAFVNNDEALLERMICNLISNAIKYTDDGRIDLRVEADEDYVLLSVSDTGPGIPYAEQSHVFEEFYQLNNPERDHHKGLGLGLAIVKRLSDLIDVQLDMDSTPGEGTAFTLTLKPYTGVPILPSANHKDELVWDDLCTLVVDDEREVGLGMKALLQSLGCQVLLADSTEGAVAVVQTQRPDILLIDFRLRGDDNGIRTIRTIRQIYPGVPAILISGDTAPERLREAEQAGIRLLHKPVPVDDLETAIAEACGLVAPHE